MDYLNIGSTPHGADCIQVGHEQYKKWAKVECTAFANQIKRYYPEVSVRTKAFPHDFGTYHEVVATFWDEDSASQAFAVEADALDKLESWDTEAIKELKAAKYPLIKDLV